MTKEMQYLNILDYMMKTVLRKSRMSTHHFGPLSELFSTYLVGVIFGYMRAHSVFRLREPPAIVHLPSVYLNVLQVGPNNYMPSFPFSE